jgi:5-methylcytosine-specific restriction endonuclease McrA
MESWEAEKKIRASRILIKFPEILKDIESGKLNLTLIELARGCAAREKLSDTELKKVLEAINGMSCRGAAREIASLYPQSFVTPFDRITPITAELSEVRFVTHNGLLDLLEEIKGLLAHSHQKLNMQDLIHILAAEFRERHHPAEKAKRAQAREAKKVQAQEAEPSAQRGVEKQAMQSRTPNMALVHQLTMQTEYKCSYIDETTQKSCGATFGLEIDHVKPWSHGGKTELNNLRYLCRAHHQRVSFLKFGEPKKFTCRKRE